ncbi:prominin-1-a-like [Plakobranchus ocellatus]|uniref:Prominin-1-a-like n=1 Tax=Plakobranchus ocellatus TaxID=259542 RepID=A0AAV4CN02_9GAST|nr:prominin-1-a-like [Plakobranchus ocellatus]
MGCLSMSSQQQRTAIADKTLENQCQVQNHSAKEIQAENRDDVPRHPSNDKRHKINFPPAGSGKQWEDLDSKIVLKIDSLLGKSTLEHKLATFGDIVYQTCLDTFGAKQLQTKCPPQKSRRQLEMDTLRKQKRKLKKQLRAASSEETNGLLVIWRQLKARHSALSRAESARKKRSQKRKNQERFIRDPFQFARQLFQQPKSGTLTVEREELETHLKKTYSDPTREIPLKETTGLVWPAAPGIKFDSKPPSLEEVIAVVNKARAKSAPGPNGLNKDLTGAPLLDLAENLRTLAGRMSPGEDREKLQESARRLTLLQNTAVVSISQKMVDLNETIKDLQKQSNLNASITNLVNHLENSQTRFNTEKDQLVKQSIGELADGISNFTHDSVDNVKTEIRTNMLGCRALSNALYTVSDSVCVLVVRPLNGFWFSLGWCLLFSIPCLVFAVLLASQYRREHEYVKDFDEPNYLMYGGPNPDTIPLTRLVDDPRIRGPGPSGSGMGRHGYAYPGESNPGYSHDKTPPPPYEDYLRYHRYQQGQPPYRGESIGDAGQIEGPNGRGAAVVGNLEA